MSNHKKAVLYLLLATVVWSTSGLFIKLSSWQPLGLNSARSLLAAAVIWIGTGRPQIRLTKPLIGGALAFAFTTITFTVANRMTTAANVIFLQYAAPVWVALLGIWLLNERPTRRNWLMMGTILVGMSLFFQIDLSVSDLLGNLLAIVSGVCLALMLISLRAQRESGAAETLVVGNLLAFLIGLYWIPNNPVNGREVGIVLYLGIVQLGLPTILLTVAIRYLTAVEAALIQTLEPILNPIWVAFILAEFPAPLALVGGGVVLTAVLANALIDTTNSPNTVNSEP